MGRETNRQRREKQASTARERAAAARAEQRRRDQRRRALVIIGSVVGIVVVGGGIAAAAIFGHHTKNDPTGDRAVASSSLVAQATSVSPATLSTVGKGSAAIIAKKTAAGTPALTSGGKPELLYVGGEFCPYCAAQRWSLVVALSKFGTFSGLKTIRSATDDGNYATFSFYGSTYTSKYLSFVPKEEEDRASKPLEKLTSQENAIFTKYTNGFPFLYYGGKYVQTSQNFDPSILGTMTQAQIAAQLNTPTSAVAKGIDGGANAVTAGVCAMTGNKPANVCLTPSITSLQSQLGA